MNYYPFHIGDYLSATRHLSWAEDMAYRRLLDTYYTSEKPLPADHRAVCRLVLATTEEQREAVGVVLQEFFTLTDSGWVNSRADSEIASMREKQQKQRDRANKRWHKPSQDVGNAASDARAMPRHEEDDAAASKKDAGAMPPTPTPTPTPTPIGIGTQPLVAEDQNQGAQTSARGVENADSPRSTPYGLACKAMKAAGLSDVNPAHPRLRAMVDGGITLDELQAAARESVAKGKGFAYALATAEGRRRDAAVIGPLPVAAGPPETAHARKMREAVEGLAPGVARRRTGAAPPPVTIDMEVQHVPAIAGH